MSDSTPAGRQRYPSDLSDAQWAVIEPLLPPPSTGGWPETHPRREIVNAILYVLRTGCAWRMLPHDFPPWQTVYWHFKRWREDGTVDQLHDRLRDQVRDQAGRDSVGLGGGSSTPNRSEPPTRSRPRAAGMTPGSAATAVNATSWSTPSGCCWW
jgi:transposase